MITPKWKKLEEYVAERLKEIDSHSRMTKASGGSSEKGDNYNLLGLAISCKQSEKTKHMPIRIDWWKKLLSEIPLHTDKLPVLITENKDEKRFATLSLDDFLDLFIEYWKLKENKCQIN